MREAEAYGREHWREWVGRDLVRIGYWPQVREWQTEWVAFDVGRIVQQIRDGNIDVLHWGVPENWYPVDGGFSKRHPSLAALDRDPYRELVDTCHRQDIRVLFYPRKQQFSL